ncbi:MAG: hypothetical protein KF709_12950 [Gemmatimonadaceae bacterium]|nr:hypothetical protein [Gemmatimonadaceae bacterium]
MHLLDVLLGALSAKGLSPDALEPWSAWVAFKEFARAAAEDPDPGVSVQIDPAGDREPVRLIFARQVAVRRDDRLEPVGAVVCELTYAPRRRPPLTWHAWSFDYPDFAHFIDSVDQHPLVADLLVTRPLSTSVYWREA